MPANVFFDTSVVVYALKKDDPRAATAEHLLSSGGFISVQVLNEFVNVTRLKLKMDWHSIGEALQGLRDLCSPAAALTLETHEAAFKIAQRYGFHIYDSLILASAIEAGCAILYSEDLQHGQKIGSLTIQNPFLHV
ncbi:putative nucleic acid-binding protein [Silvibacterium bohemicum]|uniref:Putative nucleic acid-binding protein n=1 Tax=Silvibacterium bohemicum TaxID=1577686 RepID=A0A841JWZ0_9BACT|nr:PIN domain-containing protein [Silvibacterium bohemicum]MBB6143501.1 putative nucleic acid-binding protein [Silvibacterium bohemicum]